MCGIISIIKTKPSGDINELIAACRVISHRGPDDEGFLTWTPGEQPGVWAGKDTAASTRQYWRYNDIEAAGGYCVGMGHRRLSILDLSPAGHQPMIYSAGGLAITFNGEVYNYLEIKAELEAAGHVFKTRCDTEVILHAWAEWNVACLDKFNGMFAFVILDYNKKELFAARDRFGVKPLYYYKGGGALYISSEIKQIKTSPAYSFNLNVDIAKDYLALGAVDHKGQTFDTSIAQVPPGHYLHVDLSSGVTDPHLHQWYTLRPTEWRGTEGQATDRFRELLTDAVKLRLRSDVTVGSCLSGGLDSSSIVCIAAELLKQQGDFAGQKTVTARFADNRYDEWQFAREVIKQTNAHPLETFPSFEQLLDDLDAFLWHQDEPTGSTSQFSQWAVFKKAHEAGLKVMIDGQGADEQLAGYGGNDLAFYSGLLRKRKFSALLDEVRTYKKEKGHFPVGFLIGAVQVNSSAVTRLLPAKLRMKTNDNYDWLQDGNGIRIFDGVAHSLRENLLRQIHFEPLPALLRYEDRNSMAWGVESRTPFMDYRLVEFTLGLPERFVYYHGVRKNILRKAMRGVIPDVIENRKDKMGFVTPEEVWLKGEGKTWFTENIQKAAVSCSDLIRSEQLTKHIDDIIAGKQKFSFLPWRIVCFYKWYKSMV